MTFSALTGPDTSPGVLGVVGVELGSPWMTFSLAGHFIVGKLRLREVICFAGVPQGEGYCGEQFQFSDPASQCVEGGGEESP